MNLQETLFTPSNNHAYSKLGLLALAGLFLMAMTRQPAPVSQLSRLEIIRDGNIMAVLDADTHGGMLRLMDRKGRKLITLGADSSGGPLLALHARNGTRVLALKTSENGFLITQILGDEESIIFDTELDRRKSPDRLNSIKVIAARLGEMDISILDLQHRQRDLADQLRDIRPGGRDTSIVERNRRAIQTLERQANNQDRLIKQMNSDLNRRRTDLDDLRRRIRDLERRIP